jgi:hypothetical protein
VADLQSRLGIRPAQVRPTARNAQVVTVGSLVELERITRRGLTPTLPRGSRVRLTLLRDDQPERSNWERSLSRYATACGCHVASIALLFVIVALVATRVAGGFTVAIPNLPVPVSWVLFGISAALLGKFITLYTARQSLRTLGSTIAAAANTAWRS